MCGSIRRSTPRWSERIGAALDRPREAERLSREAGRARRRARARDRRTASAATIVTSHTAFGYLADRYGLEQVADRRASPEAEPTPRELRDLVEEVRAHGATTVFFETLVSPRLAETVAREVGADTAVLNPLEGLTEDEARRRRRLFLCHARRTSARSGRRSDAASRRARGCLVRLRRAAGLSWQASTSPCSPASSSPSPARTAAARRRSYGSALGLERPTRGEALLFGEPAERFSRRSTLGYLAQRSQLGVDAPATVREVVSAGPPRRGRPAGAATPPRSRDRGRGDRARRPQRAGPTCRCGALSGGQQQRAFIAKALAGEP